MRVRRLIPALPVLVLFATQPGCNSDDYETYVATLSGTNEVPSNGSTATGRAIVLVSKSNDRLDVSTNVSGLVNPTQAHIHRAPAGTNGGVIFWLWQANNPIYPPTHDQLGKSWTNPPVEARDQPFTQTVLDDLRAGNLYVNFHSTTRPGGEIRGQLTRQ
jgi:hypothetical protein